MGLTSAGTLSLLFLLAFGCMAATVRAWPRAAAPGPRAVGARALMLLGCQLSVLLALVTALNAHYLFYGSWTDLLSAAGGGAQAHRPAGGNAAAATRVVRTVQAGLDPGPRAEHVPAKDGQVERLDIRGVRTGLSSQAYVYLPPQYFQRAHAARRFPVVILLAGYPAADRLVWIHQGHVPEDAARAQARGRIQPMIYVMMRPTVVRGWDTECADVPGGPQVETFFAQDVPEAVAETYRVPRGRDGWALAGYSTGGFCAAKLAMLHSDRFSAAVSMAGHFDALMDPTTRDLYGGSRAVRMGDDLVWRLRHLPAPPVSILVASADTGEKTFPSAQRFMRAARPPLVVDKVLLRSGGHNFKTFRKYIPPSIRWLSARLRGE
ncbi:enterochelin esterase-like enzyme [Actinomadura luteofluorescens]|uniref:Enterochelin esterase-like enzyme n=1 Tax=Actinomadura luteofluorescens TaxID=46163 RepID=A0A7Y9JI93_9ACTN|nr:alpha/beta hydrolase-fold protein [Actinomadura luteofluorescens]NYD49596.1 enterochelin esterase-like enzyme [Actinomadura luteofluorescens]